MQVLLAHVCLAEMQNHDPEPGRRTPAQGVHTTPDGATIIFCTVCADDRGTWCAFGEVMSHLHEIWLHEAKDWRVGQYLLMPDHIHFFATPSRKCTSSVERWTSFWKDRFSKRCKRLEWRWQRGVFHHRMRSEAELREQELYVLNNPVEAGLVVHPKDWPWQGRVHGLRW